MPRKLGELSEHQVQTAIIQYLRYKGYYVQRLNAGKYSVGEGRSRRFVQGVRAGTPDLMAYRLREVVTESLCKTCQKLRPVRYHMVELLFIEVKVPGNKPTPLQTEVMHELEEYGARCIVAHSVAEVEAAL